jgi:RNA polymerase sigma-70 factor (ECF subfamily)
LEYAEHSMLAPRSSAELRVFSVKTEDQRLLEGLQAQRSGAAAEFFRRYAPHVQRVLARTLGIDPELGDLVHEVFVQALQSVDTVTDGNRLKAWLTSVAVYTARGRIRARKRQRWLSFFDPHRMPDSAAPVVDAEAREALRATYRVLDRLSSDLRIPFALRIIDGMELTEVASACGVSLATIKRRLAKAEHLFAKLARREPALDPWLKEGQRWAAG